MEIDKTTLKVISADSRLEIMKKLTVRRMLPSELSKKLGLAPSTITEHLKKLEGAGLVEKKHTGHKWIYYELTDRGLGLINPDMGTKFVLVLSLGAIFVFSSAVRWFQQATSPLAGMLASDIAAPTAGVARDSVEIVNTIQNIQPAPDFMFWGLLVIGIILIVISFFYRK